MSLLLQIASRDATKTPSCAVLLCPKFGVDCYRLIYSYCWEFDEINGGESWQLVKMMVSHFVSDTDKVMTHYFLLCKLLLKMQQKLKLSSLIPSSHPSFHVTSTLSRYVLSNVLPCFLCFFLIRSFLHSSF